MLEIFLIFGGKDSIPHDLCSSLICDAAEIQNEHLLVYSFGRATLLAKLQERERLYVYVLERFRYRICEKIDNYKDQQQNQDKSSCRGSRRSRDRSIGQQQVTATCDYSLQGAITHYSLNRGKTRTYSQHIRESLGPR